MQTNSGKKGGLLKGKPHYDKSGKSLGGIKAVVTDSGQQVELEGGEVIINKEASKKHWKELSRINQSAGDGVPILPPDESDTDVDSEDYEKGGKIDFNPNKVPSKKIYNYAKKIKEKYPKVWDMGGNIFGNEAYKNLERVLKRNYWLDSEEWMYVKWQSFNARHSGDIRIAGIIANLKWLNVVDKGWQYMTNLIDEEIDKKYNGKMEKGGKTDLLSPQGTLISKDKKSKLDYKKVGDNYEFSVFDGEVNPVKNYTKTQFKKRNGNSVVMSYQQFINFIYSEGFIDDKMEKGGNIGNNFQENLDELLKAEGWSISYWDKNINDVPKEKAYQMSLSRFDPYYESIAIKLPSKMEVTFDWIMNKINKDKVYKSFSENFNKLLKTKGFGDINAYPTTYGIGVFVGFGSHISETKKNIENLLNSLGIIYTTEFSDAHYIFRYKISKSRENVEKIEQLDMKMARGGVVTYKEKYNKKYGYKPNESHNLNEVSKDTGVSKKGVQQIYNKGIGAYKTNPESVRPNVKSKEQWAMARVYSAVIGGKASKVDANELKMAKGGITGDVFSMADSEQFKQVISLMNDLLENNYAKDCFISDSDNSIVFLTGKTISEDKKKEITRFIFKTLKQDFDTFNYNKSFSQNNLIWIYADNNLQGFKIYFKKDIVYANGGSVNQKITCENCGWTWKTKDSAEFDKYICHNCNFDNSGFYAKGGELAKGIKVEKEHSKTANKLYNRKITPQQSFEQIAKDHLKEDKNYYSKLAVFENKMADGGNIDVSKFGFKTPTGKPSKLTYMQQILVRTKAFKEWFGDWEALAKEVVAKNLLNDNTTDDVLFGMYKDCSKIIDGDTLEPRLVYHGTRSDKEFYEFNTSIRDYERPYSYFAYNKEYSENFTNPLGQDWGGVYDCFIQVKNPLVMLGGLFEDAFYDGKNWMFYIVNVIFRDKYKRPLDAKKDAEFINDMIDEIGFYVYAISQSTGDSFPFWRLMGGDGKGDFKIFLQKYGYDGVIYTEEAFKTYDTSNPAHYTKAVTIFESNQVKLGDGRNVDFSTNTNDIRYKKGGVTKTPVKSNDKSYHYSLAKAVFGYGGQIEQKEILEIKVDRNTSNRQYVESLIKKMQ